MRLYNKNSESLGLKNFRLVCCLTFGRIQSMKLSVVIPTYNQSKVLPKSIDAIFSQTLSQEQYEVLVVNDGSTDETSEVVKSLQQKFNFRYFIQENKGAGAARNRGIKEAKNEIIVFIQDDIITVSNFLEEHLLFHQKHLQGNIAVVGFTTWHLDLKITPFMYWLEHGGPQFDYDRIKGKKEVDHLAFYTSNLSLKRDFLLKNGMFDESFFVAGGTAYEDTEFGFRLAKCGMRLLYNPKAIASHFHIKTLQSVCKRRFFEGKMSHKLFALHPDLKMIGKQDSLWHNITHLKTGFLSDRVRFCLTSVFLNKLTVLPLQKLALFLENKVNVPILYKLVCGYYYNKGYAVGSSVGKGTSSAESASGGKGGFGGSPRKASPRGRGGLGGSSESALGF